MAAKEGLRMSREQVRQMLTAMEDEGVDLVDLKAGGDGRLVVNAVETVERTRMLSLTKKRSVDPRAIKP